MSEGGFKVAADDEFDLADKVVFITGGAVGIGREFARQLARRNASVVLADIDQAAAQETAASITADGGRAIAVPCDVSNEEGVLTAVDQAVRELGGIDILINNAALHFETWSQPVTEMPRDMWRKLLDVNVIGVINCAAACRPSMRTRGGGVIVNMSSIAGFMPRPDFGFASTYAITKLAIRGLTVALATELAEDGIRVVGIAPGGTRSEAAEAEQRADHFNALVDLQLIKRPGTMADLVGPLLFLCSDHAAMVTGETMVVGGGFPLRI
jgi:3-oxoacyl-[acyl-carrier protein] reductase